MKTARRTRDFHYLLVDGKKYGIMLNDIQIKSICFNSYGFDQASNDIVGKDEEEKELEKIEQNLEIKKLSKKKSVQNASEYAISTERISFTDNMIIMRYDAKNRQFVDENNNHYVPIIRTWNSSIIDKYSKNNIRNIYINPLVVIEDENLLIYEVNNEVIAKAVIDAGSTLESMYRCGRGNIEEQLIRIHFIEKKMGQNNDITEDNQRVRSLKPFQKQ